MTNLERTDRPSPQERNPGIAEATLAPRTHDVGTTPARPSGTKQQPQASRPAPVRQLPERSPIESVAASNPSPAFTRQRFVRWALFALQPLALIAGSYWYVSGGRVMSTDDAYVEADKVGISTDVSGIVKELESARTSL
jgi:membrane fusion protein, multidrug efflux system